nr:hypothetical protein CFP56_03643 [Quercus suber]
MDRLLNQKLERRLNATAEVRQLKRVGGNAMEINYRGRSQTLSFGMPRQRSRWLNASSQVSCEDEARNLICIVIQMSRDSLIRGTIS